MRKCLHLFKRVMIFSDCKIQRSRIKCKYFSSCFSIWAELYDFCISIPCGSFKTLSIQSIYSFLFINFDYNLKTYLYEESSQCIINYLFSFTAELSGLLFIGDAILQVYILPLFFYVQPKHKVNSYYTT